MTNFLKHFNTLYLRLIVSYIITLCIVMVIVYLSFYKVSTSHFEEEITFLNTELLGQLRKVSDVSIIGKVEKLTVDAFLWGESAQSDIFQELLYMFDHPVEGNHDKIISANMYLRRIVQSHSELIDSIVVYYKQSGLLVSSTSMKYVDSADASFDTILKDSASTKDASGFTWIHKDHPAFRQWNLSNDPHVISLCSPYPFSGIDSNTKGFIIINLKEEELYKLINSLSPEKFGKIIIADRLGNIILQSKEEEPDAAAFTASDLEDILKDPNGSGSFVTETGNRHMVVSFVPSHVNNWIYIRIMPFEQYFSFSFVVKRLLIVICIATLVVGLVISNWFSFRMFKGIRKVIDVSLSFFNINLRKDKDFYHQIIAINDSLRKLPYNLNVFKTSFDNNLPLIRCHLFVDLLHHRLPPEARNDAFMTYFQLNSAFPFDTFHVLMIEYTHTADKASLEKFIMDKEVMKYHLSELLSRVLPLPLRFEMLDLSTGRTAVIMNFDSREGSRIKSGLRDMFDSMKGALKVPFTAAIGLPCGAIHDIHSPAQQALQCFRYRFIHPQTCFLDYEEAARWDTRNSGFPHRLYEEMDKQLRGNNSSGVVELLAASKSYIQENRLSYDYCRHILADMTTLLSRYIHDMDCSADTNLPQHKEDLGRLATIDEFCGWFEHLVFTMEDCLLRKRSNRNQDLIERVKEHIVKHPDQDLSLSSLAETFYVSSFYLSKMFKKETRVNLIDFIVDMRIEKARDMLLSTHKSIDDIALMCGYANTSYFIKKFKEKYGRTPKQYRLGYAAERH